MPPCKLKLVVRLQTSTYWWKGRNSFSHEKRISLLKSKSIGSLPDLLDDLDTHICCIVNLHECQDGLYELHPINESYDCESGLVDDYDLKLLPYHEINKNGHTE